MTKLIIRLLAKLGDDGFSLVLFGTKVADSKEFYKKSIFYYQLWYTQDTLAQYDSFVDRFGYDDEL